MKQKKEFPDPAKAIDLIASGADLKQTNGDGWTALHYAAYYLQKDIVAALLDRGAEVDVKDTCGNTALIRASARAGTIGAVDIIIMLLDHGADVNTKNNCDQTPLHEAATRGATDAINLLLDRGAKIDEQDDWGKTALMLAVIQLNQAAVQVLLEAGADFSLCDDRGKTALSLADESRQFNIINLLEAEPARRAAEAVRIAKERQENDAWFAAGMPLKEDLKLMRPAQIRRKTAGASL